MAAGLCTFSRTPSTPGSSLRSCFFASPVSASVALPARRVKVLKNMQVGKNERAAGRTASVAIIHPGRPRTSARRGGSRIVHFIFIALQLKDASQGIKIIQSVHAKLQINQNAGGREITRNQANLKEIEGGEKKVHNVFLCVFP